MNWLCAAHEKEIPGFREFSRGGWQTHALGVGQFESLAELSRLLAAQTTEGIVLVGTCGSLLREEIFQVFQCRHFAFPSVADEELPEFMPRTAETIPAIRFPDFREATVLQNHGISLSAEKFSQNAGYIPAGFPRPLLENMEAASLALYCQKRKIPFTALLCVTNQIGPDGRREWKENFGKAGELLKAALQPHIR